jgi:hypothetical protein
MAQVRSVNQSHVLVMSDQHAYAENVLVVSYAPIYIYIYI